MYPIGWLEFFIHSFIQSISQYVLSLYYMSGTLLGARGLEVNLLHGR